MLPAKLMQKTAHCLGGSTLCHIMLSIASVTVCVRYASALLQAACMHAAEQYAMCFTSSMPAMENMLTIVNVSTRVNAAGMTTAKFVALLQN